MDPIGHSLTLCRDLGHSFRVDHVPIPVQIVALVIKSHAAARDPVGIAHWDDFPLDLVTQVAKFGRKKRADPPLAHPRTAGLPAMLSKHQPNRFRSVWMAD